MAKYVLRFIAEPPTEHDQRIITSKYRKPNSVRRKGRYLKRSNPWGHYSSASLNEAYVFDDTWLPGGPHNPIDLPPYVERVYVTVTEAADNG